jgi:RNA-directed DNA polymerase
MRGADAAGTGRNPEKGCMSMSTHPWAEGSSVPDQAQLMERVVECSNMQSAYRRVKHNKGAPGVDGMNVEQLGSFLRAHWPKI